VCVHLYMAGTNTTLAKRCKSCNMSYIYKYIDTFSKTKLTCGKMMFEIKNEDYYILPFDHQFVTFEV
jgi:hypothetical protein